MNSKDNNRLEYAAGLRKLAEGIARKATRALPKSISTGTQKIIQELRVHQIELEMQNEELLQTQVKLDTERERYFDFYNLSPVGFFTVSEQGLILEANLTSATMLGVTRDALDKQPISQFIFKEDQDIYYLHRKQLFDNGGPQTFELRMVKKDGTIFYAQLEATTVEDKDRNTECRVILSDITDRKRAEIIQETNRLRLTGIIEATNVGPWEWNVQTGETVFSERWAQILGYTLSELEPVSIKTWEKFAFPDDLKQSGKQLELHFAGKLPYYDCECRMKHKDGHCVWIHDRGRVVTRTADGKPLLVLGTHSDITGRKQAEEKIMFSNILLLIQQEASIDGILVVDENNKIRWKNRRFDEIMNIPQELIENKIDESVLQLVTEQMADPPQFLRRVQYLYEHRREISSEELVLKDGRVLDRYSSPMYGSDDQYYGRCWNFRDITALKQAEDIIKLRSEELQRSNAEKDKFFSIIAHDLRSPFQYFLGLTKEMAEEFPRLTKDKMHEIAVGMRDSATNLYRLIESLLQWSIMQQGLMPFNPKTVLLLPIVNESLAMELEPAGGKGIEITCHIPEDLKVFADSNMLQSIIRNLVSNAIKFTAKGGTINLSAKYASDNNVEISVKDSGIGMSREMVDNLFRVDVRTKRKGTEGEPSTGLGLLLCKEFVGKQGGGIRVESEEGKGSVFYFTIPCNPQSETRKKNQPGNLKILIVEDDEKSEILIVLEVENFGKEVLKTRTGGEAVAACRNNPDIDLVLMDIEMPGMNGYEATKQIRQFNKDVVIIAQTAYALTGDREKAIAAGCNDYIAKPYNKTSLTALLKKYF